MRGQRISYSADELAWIKARAAMPRKELRTLFVAAFNRPEVTHDNLKALCVRMGWSAGPDARRRNRGKSTVLTPEQIDWLRANATLSRADVEPAFRAAFPDAAATAAQIIGWRKRNKVKTGRTGHFEKGHAPWTKGRKLPPNANSQATQFRRGRNPHNAKSIGYESLNPDGYVLICVDRPNPFTGYRTHMAFKHKELWVAEHGPIPDGHVLKCLDGDKTNCDPSNWECIPQGMLPRLNGKSGRAYDHAPAELKPTIFATAKLEHRLSGLRKGERA